MNATPSLATPLTSLSGTSSSPASPPHGFPAPSPQPSTHRSTMLAAGPIRIILSDEPADIVAAQRLRYRVFADEPGFSDEIGDHATQRDADRFDEFCDHLIVEHEDDGVIGCARLLPPTRAVAAGGWYSTSEFDTGELDVIAAETVEMGRACVAGAHRSGSITALVWAGLLQYMEAGAHRYLIGCVSSPLAGSSGERGRDLRAVRDHVRDRSQAPDWQVYPHRRARVDGVLLDDIEPADKTVLPPLMRGYLRLGALVCGEPAVDEIFDVADFLTVLDRHATTTRYLERLRESVARLSGGPR